MGVYCLCPVPRRYRVERIVEFYASTEGNVNMVNNTGKVGAVGVIPWFTEGLYPILLLRIDPGEPFRCSLRILSFLASIVSGWRCGAFGLYPFCLFFPERNSKRSCFSCQ